MVRKMEELPNFLLFNPGKESIRNISVFTFFLLLFTLYRFLYLLFGYDQIGVSNVFMVVFSDEHE
jgi:hypothetical protein